MIYFHALPKLKLFHFRAANYSKNCHCCRLRTGRPARRRLRWLRRRLWKRRLQRCNARFGAPGNQRAAAGSDAGAFGPATGGSGGRCYAAAAAGRQGAQPKGGASGGSGGLRWNARRRHGATGSQCCGSAALDSWRSREGWDGATSHCSVHVVKKAASVDLREA